MASVRHGRSNRRALSQESGPFCSLLERASISADKGVVRGLGHGVHDSLAIGSLEWF